MQRVSSQDCASDFYAAVSLSVCAMAQAQRRCITDTNRKPHAGSRTLLEVAETDGGQGMWIRSHRGVVLLKLE